MINYEHVEDLTEEEVDALARRLLKLNDTEATRDSLYEDPDRIKVYDAARRLGIPPAYLLEGMTGKLAIARLLVKRSGEKHDE